MHDYHDFAKYVSRFAAFDFTGFLQVMENLESRRILWFHFPGLESHGILVCHRKPWKMMPIVQN